MIKEIIKEMSIAGFDDWEPSEDLVAVMSVFVLKKYWTFIDKVKINGKSFNLYKLKNSYILGNFKETSEKEIFEVDFRIDLKEESEIKNKFNLKKSLFRVDGVMTNKNKRGFGIGTFMYKYLIKNENILLISDRTMFFGARKLWVRLSKSIDVVVDIIDIKNYKVLEKDVKLHHGDEDWDFDERVWSYDTDKAHIRLVLKDIKEK
jgi:hypothetical protein